MKQQKVQMKVSIASSDWSYQPQQVVMLDIDLAKAWRAAGHCIFVTGPLPVTDFSGRDGLSDLDAEQALHHRCTHCDRRAAYVFQNRAYCPVHYLAETGS